MKKLLACALLVMMFASVASGAVTKKLQNLGQDSSKMTWYLTEYGTDDNGVPYAIARKYYTSDTVKKETVDLLMSKFNIPAEKAGELYFTEYGYEFTPDGKQFALTYLRHYDMLGNEIHGTVYDGSSDDKQKTFAAVTGMPQKASNYALGKPQTTTTTTKKAATTKKTTSKTARSKVVKKK